jgi:hypothetical protein
VTQPLRLKKPKGPKNWYRSGRWHKVRPKPGRTEFRVGDLCQFKPDLFDVKVTDVFETVHEGVKLYRVCVLSTGHSFSTYGSDLLLLERHKPELYYRIKPKLIFRPKPKLAPAPKLKPVLKIRNRYEVGPVVKPKFHKPAPGVIARLSFYSLYGAWGPQWGYIDFTNEKELEAEFWKRVEEKPIRRHKYDSERSHRFGVDETGKPLQYPVITDRRSHPEWVCIEWFGKSLDKYFKEQDRRRNLEQCFVGEPLSIYQWFRRQQAECTRHHVLKQCFIGVNQL